MISKEMRHLIETGSTIRKMWMDGLRLKKEHGAENVADATLGNPVMEPPEALTRALAEIASDPPAGLHRYTPNHGLPATREAVAADLDSRDLLPGVRPEHVVLTCGASAALNVAFRTILEPGEEVIFLAPHFPDFPAHVMNHGGVPVAVATTADFLPDLARIEAALTKRTRAVIVNHPNNPSGRQYPAALLTDLVALLAAQGGERPVFLISDEPYREIRYTDEPFVSPASLYEYGLMTYSWSKSLALAGERMGYVALNPNCPEAEEIAGALALANRILGFTNAPAIWQHVIARVLPATVDITPYRRHRDRLMARLTELGYEFTVPEGAFYLFSKTPGGDDEAFVRKAMDDLLLVVPGGTFGTPGHFRLAFCTDDRTVDLIAERLPPASEF